MKSVISVICLLFMMTVQAEEAVPYQHTGIITAVPEQNGTVVISNQVYLIDMNTRVHGPVPGGELGPTPIIGSEVGFNLQLRDNTHYITDLWALDNDDD